MGFQALYDQLPTSYSFRPGGNIPSVVIHKLEV